MSVRKILCSRKLFLGAAVVSILYILLMYSIFYQIDDWDRKRIDKFKYHIGSELCKFPVLPVNASEMIKFVKTEPPINCSSDDPDWVVVEGSVCRISDIAKKRYISITCIYTDIIRVDDFHVQDGHNFTRIDNKPFTLRNSDVVRVNCKSPHTHKKWQAVLTGIRHDPEIFKRTGWSKLPADALRLNVLMFGFDSLSRNTVIRKLPKSYKYLTEVLGAHVLQGYNIVGDGTPKALIPILTGKGESELPNTKRGIPGSTTVDVYPFVWNDFKKFGYVTGYLEDMVKVGTFTYRLNGFKDPPTDHYMRPYYVASETFWSNSSKLCYGSIPRHKIMMNHIRNFFSVYKNKPKFMFGFHGELSHSSYNFIGLADDDLLKFFMDLNDEGYLKDTILIFMADHGHRFASIRDTVQGKKEELLPFFSFTFPPSFKTEQKEAYYNFVNNKNVLTHPFDIYPTLKDVISLGNTGPANMTQKSLSLFSQISNKRSCSDTYIEPHWCACLEWQELPLDAQIILNLTATFVHKLNNFTESHRHLCEKLSLKKLIWVTQLSPDDNLRRFKKNSVIEAFIADLSLKMKVTSNLYQIKVELEPGDSLFEAGITHYLNENKFDIKMSDISRINMYGRQARCIENEFPHLRKYCYCKDDL